MIKNTEYKEDLYSCEFCRCTHGELHADIKTNLIKNEYGQFILIEDMNEGNRSVTNDIQWVLWAVNDYYVKIYDDFNISDFKIIYRDSMGFYDGITIVGDKFNSFYPIHEKDLEQAMKKSILI